MSPTTHAPAVPARPAFEPLEPRRLMAGAIELTKIGGIDTGGFDEGAAEITAYDPRNHRLFVVNAQAGTVDVVDLSDPARPATIRTIDVSPLGSPNSVAVSRNLVAVAVESDDRQQPGKVALYQFDSFKLVNALPVGSIPDMLTFTPDGSRLLVANEGEPSGYGAGHVDPEGSVSIVDIPNGVGNVKKLKAADVRTAGFGAWNGRRAELLARGVRVFGPDATVAQDLEPEYITVADDGRTAYVTLQEANAYAIVDIRTATVRDIIPFGYKDHSKPIASLKTYAFGPMPTLGTTDKGQPIPLGGFSGLTFEGYAPDGDLKFITHTDRGPNGEPNGAGQRPFLLPDFAPEVIRFTLDTGTGKLALTQRIPLKRVDGTPLTGLPNTTVAGGNTTSPHNDEVPIDLYGNVLPLDPLGGDFEGIVVDPNDGTFWMVDEYRPAIYHFDTGGRLIDRFVPAGAAAAAGQPAGTFGTEVLPAELAQRRQNRGFEAVAFQDGKVYAFVQSPIRNPAGASNGTLNGLRNVRIVEFDPATTASKQFIYTMDNPNLGTPGNTRPDKLGDAVAIGNGQFLVVERDDDSVSNGPASNIEKKIYRLSLAGATDVTGLGPINGKTVDQMTPAELADAGIKAATKALHVDLNAAGYNTVEKVEGLALIDANTIAVLNDNDFTVGGTTPPGDGTFVPDPTPDPIVLGIIRTTPTGIDASDRDNSVNIANRPVFGMYQPDAIASFVVNGQTFLVTANEGDARSYAGLSEEARVGSLALDPVAFPNGATLKNNANLGRLNVTNRLGDTDGDGDFDRLYAFGGRSFSIWTPDGRLVYDSGDDFERITAAAFPAFFNASSTDNAFDSRSDNKGPEPEGVTLGAIAGRTYAFVGLERIGGVMVYDVTDPTAPAFVQYINPRDFAAAPDTPAAGDLGPEGLTFVSAEDSPNGKPLLIVANEVSGTVAVFEIAVTGAAREDDDDDDDDEEDDDNAPRRGRQFTLGSWAGRIGSLFAGDRTIGSIADELLDGGHADLIA